MEREMEGVKDRRKMGRKKINPGYVYDNLYM